MLRLAFAATLMYSAAAVTYSGDVITLYSYFDTDEPGSAVDCQEASDGLLAGPVLDTATNLNGAKPIILGACYETNGLSTNTAELPVGSVFGGVGASGTNKYEASVGSGAVEVKWDIVGTDVKMTAYTGTKDGCAAGTTTAVTAETGGDVDSTTEGEAGWACREALSSPAPSPGLGVVPGFNSLSMGINNVATGGSSAAVTGVNYVTVTFTDDNTTGGTVDCDRATGTTTINTVAGSITDYWPICANDADCVPGSCDDSTATVVYKNESACLANDAAAVWTAGSGNFTKAHWALCYPTANGAGSWQLSCDQETGNMVHTHDADSTYCAFTSNATVTQIPQATMGALGLGDTDTSWCLSNSTTEFDAMCKIPAHTAAAKYFKGYQVSAAGTCATHDATKAAAHSDGTKDIFMDVCYTLETDGQMAGWQGPFVTAAAAAAEPIASMLSYKWTEGTANIELLAYDTHDCSGGEILPTVTNGGSWTRYNSDDPAAPSGTALEWPCVNSSLLSHGGVGTSGNAATILQTATNYLTVRQYPSTAALANAEGLPGDCTGVKATGVAEAPTSGLILDYFRVGTSATDGCHQMTDGTSTTATVAQGYSWWCDTSDGSINYGTFHTADCSATPLAGALRFTKKAYDACTEADSLDTNTTCTGNGPATAIEAPSAFVFATVNTLSNGAAADFGGKCLVANQSGKKSWGILTDDTTWDAICSVPTPAPATSTTTSGAGKVAATAAAAAAAAAILL